MALSGVIAIIRSEALEEVERRLESLGVTGITVSKVKAYGEYRNFFTPGWQTSTVRLEIFTRGDKVDSIVAAITDAAHSGARGDGVVAVYPIDRFVNVRLRSDAIPDADRNVDEDAVIPGPLASR